MVKPRTRRKEKAVRIDKLQPSDYIRESGSKNIHIVKYVKPLSDHAWGQVGFGVVCSHTYDVADEFEILFGENQPILFRLEEEEVGKHRLDGCWIGVEE